MRLMGKSLDILNPFWVKNAENFEIWIHFQIQLLIFKFLTLLLLRVNPRPYTKVSDSDLLSSAILFQRNSSQNYQVFSLVVYSNWEQLHYWWIAVEFISNIASKVADRYMDSLGVLWDHRIRLVWVSQFFNREKFSYVTNSFFLC